MGVFECKIFELSKNDTRGRIKKIEEETILRKIVSYNCNHNKDCGTKKYFSVLKSSNMFWSHK